MVKRTPVRGERGQILIVTVLSMTVLLGMAALSIDASFMYDRRNVLHAAADAAAKSVAAELQRNSGLTATDARNFANQQVVAHGLVPGACGTTATGIAGVCLNFPPATGPFAGTPGYVEATVSEVTPTFFGYVLGFVSATPGGRAVAGISASPNCLVALNGLTIERGRHVDRAQRVLDRRWPRPSAERGRVASLLCPSPRLDQIAQAWPTATRTRLRQSTRSPTSLRRLRP